MRPIDADDLASGGNILLAVLSRADRATLAPHARRVRMARGHVLHASDHPATVASFLERGIASVVKRDERPDPTELFLIGREGFVGSALLLADGRWPYETLVLSDDLTAIQIDAAAFVGLVADNPRFRMLLLSAVQAQMVQIAEGLVSAAWQRVPARLARWLLMYRDRSESDQLEVTHLFIATMIGVQRTGITAVLHDFEGDGLITAGRARITLRDLPGLRRLADGTYGSAEREQARLLRHVGVS